MITGRDLVAWFEKHYPRSLAEDWDSIGVIAGDWNAPIDSIVLSVDITNEVLDHAIAMGAQCVVSHHPLVLPRHSVVTEDYKYRMVARANAAQVFLFNAHTNADHARPGVADALADLLGVVETEALIATSMDSVTGTGRVGQLASPCTVTELVERINDVLPGARARAHGEGMVSTVALCPGAGDSFLGDARKSGVDVYITSDLRHHPVQEHEQAGGCPLIDINHVAAESAWLPVLQSELLAELPVKVSISSVDTRAWRSN